MVTGSDRGRFRAPAEEAGHVVGVHEIVLAAPVELARLPAEHLFTSGRAVQVPAVEVHHGGYITCGGDKVRVIKPFALAMSVTS